MKINYKTRYAIRALIEIALNPEGILQKDIAKNQNISEKFLDHIIASLKVAGFIKNIKGKRSGYMLTKTPKKITMYHIIKTFELVPFHNDCIDDTNSCSKSNRCAAQFFWKKFRNNITNFLSGVNLSELIEQQRKLNRKKK